MTAQSAPFSYFVDPSDGAHERSVYVHGDPFSGFSSHAPLQLALDVGQIWPLIIGFRRKLAAANCQIMVVEGSVC